MSRSCFLMVSIALVAHMCHAQSPPTRTQTVEAQRLAERRRAEARAVLISLASDARSFRDGELRARSLARIADSLWEVEPEQARTLFRLAWEAATTVNQKNTNLITLRTEILALVSRRDRPLAEELLQKLRADQQETKADDSQASSWALSNASQQRLTLAEKLLESGDIERALQFADPILNTANISTLDFLTRLRGKDPSAADQRYAALLTNPNLAADANTISLLSSYIFTPRRYVTFDSSGAAESSWPSAPLPPANVSSQLRLAFFQNAIAVLLRTQSSPEQEQTATGVIERYLVMKQILPLFEQYAPKDLTEALRGQFTALTSQISDNVRNADDDRVQQELGLEKSSVDREEPLVSELEHARTSADRDNIYFRLALIALSKQDAKCREYASKIEDSNFREQVQTWVDWGLATQAIKNAKAQTAVELARAGELNHIQKVWIFTQAAKLLAKTDRDQALSLLDEATAEVHRIDGGDLDRPRGFFAVANALNVVARARVWEAIFDAVKAANSAENFKGDDGVIALTVATRGQIMTKADPVSDFNLEGIFKEVANNDFDRALQLARGFRDEAPRANATIAICQTLLNAKRDSLQTSVRGAR